MGRVFRVAGAALVATLLVLSGISMVGCSSPTEPSDVGPSPPVATPPAPAPPPTASMSGLSDEARRLVQLYNVNAYGEGKYVVGWARERPIRVYAHPGFRREDLVTATNFWQQELSGKVMFQIVEVRSEAEMVFDLGPDTLGLSAVACGTEGPDKITKGVIVAGTGYFVFGYKPGCMNREDEVGGLAHGIGHVLGFSEHTTPVEGPDLMSSPASRSMILSRALSEAMNWIYSVPPGTIVTQ